jgi:hypothetical protein
MSQSQICSRSFFRITGSIDVDRQRYAPDCFRPHRDLLLRPDPCLLCWLLGVFAAKGAVETLTIYLVKELGSRGITANTIAPGAIATDFLSGAVRDMPAYNQAFAAMIALGRSACPTTSVLPLRAS